MNAQLIAKTVQEDAAELSKQFTSLNDEIKKTIINVTTLIKKTTGELPTKEVMLQVLAILISDNVPNEKIMERSQLNPFLKFFEGAILNSFKLPVITAGLTLLDESTLTKLFGDDWYEQLLTKI